MWWVICGVWVWLLAGCGKKEPCDDVPCSAGRVCEPTTGTCVATDGGF